MDKKAVLEIRYVILTKEAGYFYFRALSLKRLYGKRLPRY